MAFDLQLGPAAPGMRLHRLEKATDPGFCSVRVNADIRLIVHRGEASLFLCYVGHHGDAYRWPHRRKIERHPTGAAQLVEIRERVEEIGVPPPEAASLAGGAGAVAAIDLSEAPGAPHPHHQSSCRRP